MESLYQDIFHQTAAGIAIVNVDGSFRHVNPRFCEIVGYTEEELKQITFAEITHPDDLHLDQAYINQVISGEIDSFALEKRYIHKNGSVIWVDLHSNVKRNAIGQIEYAIATIVDINQRKNTQLENELNRVRFQFIFEEQKSGILILEAIGDREDGTDDFVVRQVNSAFCELFDAPASQFLGKGLIAVYPQLREMHILTVIQTVLENGEPYYQPTSLYADQNLHFWFDIHISRLPNHEIMVIINDETAEVETRNAITAERDRAQQIFDIAGIILLTLDLNGNISAINQHGASILGARQEELIGENWFKRFILPVERENVQKVLRGMLAGKWKEKHRVENEIITTAGEIKTIAWTNTLLHNENGEVIGTLSSGEDVTEQRKMIHELQLINSVIENSLNAFGIVDHHGKFIYVNQAYVEMWGYDSAEEIIGKSPAKFMADPSQAARNIEIVNQEGKLISEFEAIRKNKSRFFILSHIWLDHDVQGNPIYPATSIDITRRNHAQEELERSRAQLRLLANHIQNAREEERQHLSREMHDQFGQLLSGMKMDISWLKNYVPLDEKAKQRMQGMNELVDQAITLTRQISRDLRPGILDDLGLFAALEWYAEEFTSRSGIEVQLSLPEEEPKLSPALVTALFRIFQESLTNVYRHSDATAVAGSFVHEFNQFVFSIQDNGKGMPEQSEKEVPSFGILGMHERVNILGGNLIILSQPGIGTRITATFPDQSTEEPRV